MKKTVLLVLTVILPFAICDAAPGKKGEKEGAFSNAGKHGLEPASENIKKAIDENVPLLSEGMKGLGKEFGQVMMQNLPQNIALAGAIVMGTVVVSKVADASIRHIEKTISGELAYEQIENKRKMLESYRSFVGSHSTMSDESKKRLIIIKEHQTALIDLVQCYKSTVSQWIPFTRSKLYCDENEFPMECTEEYFRYKGIFPSPYAERVQKEIFPIFYQKK